MIVIGNGFGADEALLEIGVDGARGLRRARAFRHRPGARLLRAGGEERDQAEQMVSGADEPIKSRFFQPEVIEELRAFAFRQLRDLFFNARRDRDATGAVAMRLLLDRDGEAIA